MADMVICEQSLDVGAQRGTGRETNRAATIGKK